MIKGELYSLVLCGERLLVSGARTYNGVSDFGKEGKGGEDVLVSRARVGHPPWYRFPTGIGNCSWHNCNLVPNVL